MFSLVFLWTVASDSFTLRRAFCRVLRLIAKYIFSKILHGFLVDFKWGRFLFSMENLNWFT